MIKLSVNINKVASIRNARGGNRPNILQTAIDCEAFGADGITVHPRPDERHIKYADLDVLAPALKTEFNIEGNPCPKFIEKVLHVRPAQVTLVPDSPDAITSNAGWNTRDNFEFLSEVVAKFKNAGIRTSIFVDADEEMIEWAAKCDADRVELYTEPYAANYSKNREEAIAPFIVAAKKARSLGLGLNAGHDLSLENLAYFAENIPWLKEVSIGHALICDALYLGLEETIKQYKQQLKSVK